MRKHKSLFLGVLICVLTGCSTVRYHTIAGREFRVVWAQPDAKNVSTPFALLFSKGVAAPDDMLVLTRKGSPEVLWQVEADCCCGVQWNVYEAPGGNQYTVIVGQSKAILLDNHAGNMLVLKDMFEPLRDWVLWNPSGTMFAVCPSKGEADVIIVYDVKTKTSEKYLQGHFLNHEKWVSSTQLEAMASKDVDALLANEAPTYNIDCIRKTVSLKK